jgi:hypothetical protein
MDALTDPPTPAAPKTWTIGEIGFLVFIAFVIVMVTWLGVLDHQQAMKTEGTKRNGEQWAAWLTQESAKRFEPGYALGACAGGPKAAVPLAADAPGNGEAAAAPLPAPNTTNTWGDCLAQVLAQTQFKDMRNPFTGKQPVFIDACDPSDYSLIGSIAFDKVTPNPPGSAIATVTSPLLVTDSIGDKVQLKITICDKGSYTVKVAETEF